MVANLVDADLLLMLSDIAGLYSADPNREPRAGLIPRVEQIDEHVERSVAGSASSRGTGGMATKVQAAKLATSSGVVVVIASGREPDIMLRVVDGEAVGTMFIPTSSKMESRKRWLMSGLSCKGQLRIDAGAASALEKEHKSLLPAGIIKVEGGFGRGDAVVVRGPDGHEVGRGLVAYDAEDAEKIKGRSSADVLLILGYTGRTEMIHRDDLVLGGQ